MNFSDDPRVRMCWLTRSHRIRCFGDRYEPFTRLLQPGRRGGSITVNRMAKYEKGQSWLPSELLAQYEVLCGLQPGHLSNVQSWLQARSRRSGGFFKADPAELSIHALDPPPERCSPKPRHVDPAILGSTEQQTEYARFLLSQYRTTETWLERQLLGDQLLQLGGPALPALRGALRDDSRPHRHFVVTLLGRMVDEREALGLITEVLSNPPDDWVMRAAFEALSNHLQATPQLLTDKFQNWLRARLAGPLDDGDESASVRRVAAVLADRHVRDIRWQRRLTGTADLEIRSPLALPELERRVGSRAWWTSEIIRNLHSGAGVDLMLLGLVAQAIESIDDKLRAEASVIVAASAHRELVAEVITESLNGERMPPTIEHALISFLEHLRPDDLATTLCRKLSSSDPRLQVTAGYSLRAVDRISTDTMTELQLLYRRWRNMQPMDEVRRSVIAGVGKRGRDSALVSLALTDPNPFVRIEAVDANR